MAAARLRLIAALAIAAAWQALASSGLLFRDVVPSLWRIAAALVATVGDPAFYANLGVTSEEFAFAVLLGGIAGAAAGLVLGANRFLAAAYERWVHYLAPVPKIIFFPALLLAFGAGARIEDRDRHDLVLLSGGDQRRRPACATCGRCCCRSAAAFVPQAGRWRRRFTCPPCVSPC